MCAVVSYIGTRLVAETALCDLRFVRAAPYPRRPPAPQSIICSCRAVWNAVPGQYHTTMHREPSGKQQQAQPCENQQLAHHHCFYGILQPHSIARSTVTGKRSSCCDMQCSGQQRAGKVHHTKAAFLFIRHAALLERRCCRCKAVMQTWWQMASTVSNGVYARLTFRCAGCEGYQAAWARIELARWHAL